MLTEIYFLPIKEALAPKIPSAGSKQNLANEIQFQSSISHVKVVVLWQFLYGGNIYVCVLCLVPDSLDLVDYLRENELGDRTLGK